MLQEKLILLDLELSAAYFYSTGSLKAKINYLHYSSSAVGRTLLPIKINQYPKRD